MCANTKFICFLFLVCFNVMNLFAQYDFMQAGSFRNGATSHFASYKGDKYDQGISYTFRSPNRIEKGVSIRGIQRDGNHPMVSSTSVGVYSIEEINKIPYLNITWSNNITEKYLMLVNDTILCLYTSNSEPVFFGVHYYDTNEEGYSEWAFEHIFSFTDFNTITASSALREGYNYYSPRHLGETINNCWAEGVEGQGIGEYLLITKGEWSVYSIYISIGYVSFTRPNLYMENSRPKKIRVSYGNIEQEITLEDTPNFQEIPLRTGMEEIKIELLEVYPGTIYQDTCINTLLHKFAGN